VQKARAPREEDCLRQNLRVLEELDGMVLGLHTMIDSAESGRAEQCLSQCNFSALSALTGRIAIGFNRD